MQQPLIERCKALQHLSLKHLGEKAEHGQNWEEVESIAQEAILPLSLQLRIARYNLEATWWDAHHLRSFGGQRLPPLGILPQQRPFFVSWWWETAVVLKETRHCRSRRAGSPVCRMEKLTGKGMHGTIASWLHNRFGVQHGAKTLVEEALVGQRLVSNVS